MRCASLLPMTLLPMTLLPMTLFALALLGLGLLLPVPAGLREAAAEETWEAEVRAARTAQDKEIRAALRQGSVKNVVITYQSRHQRRGTVLNKYLLARVLYYDKRGNDAARLLKECLRANPRFWFANQNLALLAFEQSKYDYALIYIDRVLEIRPKDLTAVELRTRILLAKGEMQPALDALLQLLETDPGNSSIRMTIAQVYVKMKRLPDAERELEALKKAAPGNIEVLEMLGMIQFELEKYVEAARNLERVLYVNGTARHVMAALEAIYTQLEDRKRLIRNYERMLPLIGDPKAKASLEQRIADLRAGGPIKPPVKPKFPDDPFAQLVERCLSDDVELRRKALHEYYAANIPVVHAILYSRVDPRLEPDAQCRVLLVRIIGNLDAITVVRVIGISIFDPDPSVRAVAAEELGRIRQDASILYLIEYLFAITLSPAPEGEEARQALEREFNAGRLALKNYAEFQDQPITAPKWVALDRATEVRERWRAYLSTEAGIELKLRGIKAFWDADEPNPERTLVMRVFDKSPKVGLAAYAATLRHVDRLAATTDDFMAGLRERWATFPRVDAAQQTPAGLPEIRKQVRAWYEELRKSVEAARAARKGN